MNLDPKQLDTTSVQKYISQTTEVSASSEIMHILQDAMPRDIITPFTEGKTMQVLVIAIITALIISLMRIEDRQAIQRVSCCFFGYGGTYSPIRFRLFN